MVPFRIEFLPFQSLLHSSSSRLHINAVKIWTLTSLFYCFQFFLRSSPNAMAPQLMADFAIDARYLGLFSSAYYWVYASLQIPVGLTLDVLGPKRVLRIGTLTCVIGALIFGLSTHFWMAVLGRCLIGAGAAVSFIGSVRMNTLWFRPEYLAFVVGLLSAVGKTGGACANAFLPKMVAYASSWHSVILWMTFVGFCVALLMWILGKDGPEDYFKPAITQINVRNILQELKIVACKPAVWILGLYGYSMYLTLSVFSDTFSVAFLERWLSVSTGQAAWMAALVALGSGCGAPTLSFLSDFFKRRLLFIQFSVFMTTFFSSFIFFGPVMPVWAASMLLFMFGFFSGGQVLVFVTGTENCPKRLAGVTIGVINAVLMLGGAVHNPLVGGIIQWSWDGTKINNCPIYSLANYRQGFMCIYIFFILAFVLSFFLKETHPSRGLKEHA